VTETVVEPAAATLEGVMLQVALSGVPAQAKVVGSAVAEVKRSGNTAFWPLAMVTVVSPSGVRAKSTALPVRWRICGERGALSVMVRVPVRAPPAVGEKTSWRVQALATGSVVPQVSLPGRMLKSPVRVVL
jgi:hypothetical protein